MADNFSFLNALGIALNARAIDLGGGILYLPGTILMDSSGNVLIGAKLAAASLPVALPTDLTPFLIVGNVAHDSPDSGGPIKLGGRAFGVIPANVTANDRVDAYFDLAGRLGIHDGGLSIGVNDFNGSLTTDTPQLPTVLGQALMAASLSVAIASDQSAIPISGTVTVNQPVTVTGTVSITQPVAVTATQLPAALGQTTMANSLPVVIASNQTEIPVSSDQLPAALGPTGEANSLPVVFPTDMQDVPTTEQRFSIKGRYTEAAVDTSGPNGDIKVEAVTSPPSYAGAEAPTIEFFDGDDAGFGASPRYMYIPLQGSGLAYDKVSLYVYCSLVTGVGAAIDTVVNLYAVENSGSGELWSPLDTVTLNTDTKRGVKWGKGTGGSAVTSALLTGAGSPVYRALDALMGPIEYLVVEIDPSLDPDDGEIRIVVIRERGSN